jgi:hypothetical protein
MTMGLFNFNLSSLKVHNATVRYLKSVKELDVMVGRSIDGFSNSSVSFPDFITAAVLLVFGISGRCSSNDESRSLVSRTKDSARVPDVKENRGEDDHAVKEGCQSVDRAVIKQDSFIANLHALQPNENSFIMKSRAGVALAQLINPENTSNEDGQDRKADERRKDFESGVEAVAGNYAGSDVAGVAESVLDREADEGEQDGDLE